MQAADHFNEFGFSQAVIDGVFAQGGDWAHANAAEAIPPNNHVDPRFAAGNVIVSLRHTSTVAIFDRVTDAVVWTSSLANGQHNSHMIDADLPGAGNILVFDNGLGDRYTKGGTSRSRVIEIDPIDNSIPYGYTAEDSGAPDWTFDS